MSFRHCGQVANEVMVAIVVKPTSVETLISSFKTTGNIVNADGTTVSISNSTSITTTVNKTLPAAPRANLSMSISTSPTPAILNTNLTYTVTVFPTPSTVPISEVVLTYGLPQNFTLVSVQATQGNCSTGRIIECQLGILVGEVTLTIIVLPTTVGNVNTALSVTGKVADEKGNLVATSVTEPVTITMTKPLLVQIGFGEGGYTVTELDNQVTLTVTRTGDNDRTIAIDFLASDETAVAGRNYLYSYHRNFNLARRRYSTENGDYQSVS